MVLNSNASLGCILSLTLLCVSCGAGGKSVHKSRECDFGVLPGRYVINGTFPAWRIFDPRCPLEDRLSGLLDQDQRDAALGVHHMGAERQALKILLFGDSVEQWITRDICSHFTKEADNILSVKDSHARYCSGHHWNCASCSTHGFILAREASHGVLTTYPFEQEAVNSTQPLVERIPKVNSERVSLVCAVITVASWPAKGMYALHMAFWNIIACNILAGYQGV